MSRDRMFLLLLFLSIVTPSLQSPVVLLNQTNAYTLYYDLSNRIECHNYTDLWGYPLIYVVDDFVMPLFNEIDVSRDCTAIVFNFTTIRLKVDTDPYSITTRLFYHDYVTGGPRATPFFSHSRCSPDKSCRWPLRLNVPMTTSIAISNGDMDVDGVTPFDLSMIPASETIWAGFYVSVPDHPSTSILRENSLFWMTLDNKTGSTPIKRLFYNDTLNNHYKYRDANNLHRNGFTQWTDASLVQPIIGIQTTTLNMAWTVSLLCNATNTSVLSPFQTLEPTSEPTQEPTVSPTMTPTEFPTTMTPTTEPPIIIDDNSTTKNNTVNETGLIEKYLRDRQTIIYAVVIAMLLSCFTCFAVCFCYKYYKYRKSTGKTSLAGFLGKHQDRDIEMGPVATSYSEYKEEQQQRNYSGDENDQPATHKRRPQAASTWTGKETYSHVSLSDQDEQTLLSEADDRGHLDQWLGKTVPNIGVIGKTKQI